MDSRTKMGGDVVRNHSCLVSEIMPVMHVAFFFRW